MKTNLTELVGCSVPIQLATMGGIASKVLATAIAEAGGLGMIAATGMSVEQINTKFDYVDAHTSGAVGIGFILPFADKNEGNEVVAGAARRAEVVEFFYDDPDAALIDIVHANGALATWQVGSTEEALAAVESGCDFVVVQGREAGGHVRGKMSLITLLSEVLDFLDVPVVAAGGIGNGRKMAAMLAAGADGVRIGTRFIGSVEAPAHPEYVEALIKAKANDTILTEGFSVGWENAPHRVLRASLEAAQALDVEFVAEWNGVKVRRLSSFTPRANTTGHINALPHWAGESVGSVQRVEPAADILQEIMDDCQKFLKQ